jgi:hypothetical protein
LHRSRAEDALVSFLRAGRGATLPLQSGGAEVMPKHPFTGVTNEARQARADGRLLQAAGARSLRDIAAALNERGISTPRGGHWQAETAAQLLARMPA